MSNQPEANSAGRGPLAELKVVELGAIGPVPLAGAMLSDLGADVVLVERPGAKEPDQITDVVRRGRRIIQLDLKDEADRSRLIDSLRTADVLLEGFRPGTIERLGLDPEMLLENNPRLIIGRMTGWGQHGERCADAGHDINYLSLTGHLSAITDPEQRPVVPLNLVGDYGGGTMFLLLGVLSALHERANSGRGQVIDSAMVDGAAMLGLQIWSMRGMGTWTDTPFSNPLDGSAPWYGVYETRDGRYMAVGSIEPQFYELLLEGLGVKDIAPDRADKANWPRLKEIFAERFLCEDMAHWTSVFYGTDACVSPVLTYEEALDDDHMRSRHTFTELGGVPQPAPAPRFSRTPAPTPEWPPQAVGEGTDFWS